MDKATTAKIIHGKAHGKSFSRVGREIGISKDKAQKIVRRARVTLPHSASNLPPELTFSGDVLIMGDLHADCAHEELFGLAIKTAKARKIKQAALVGDLFNFDYFSMYPQLMKVAPIASEIAQAKAIVSHLLANFDRVYLCRGNHDQRISYSTDGEISLEMLASLISNGQNRDRLVVTMRDRMWLKTPTGLWLLCHQSEYSPERLKVANRLADKYHCHVITHHQHQMAVGVSRDNRYVIADNGCMVDPKRIAYKEMNTNSRPEWNLGFAWIQGGRYDFYAHDQPIGAK